MAAYLLLTVAFIYWKHNNIKEREYKGFQVYFMIALFISVSTELVQYFIPGRVLNPYDVLANTTGLLLGGFYFIIFIKAKKTNKLLNLVLFF